MSRTLHIVAVAATLLAALLISDAWRISRRNSVQLTATLSAQNALITQAATREQQRNHDLATALASIAAEKKRVQTPQQAAAAIPTLFPQLPLPIKISLPNLIPSPQPPNQPPSRTNQSPHNQFPDPQAPNKQTENWAPEHQDPDDQVDHQSSNDQPPASIFIPQPDLKPLYDTIQDGRACILERDATKKDLADEQSRLAAVIRERDAALVAAHGGNFWSHIKQSAKWFAIGALTAAIATKATSH